jgi:hypothetical protein
MRKYPPDYYETLNMQLSEDTRYVNRISLLRVAISDYYKSSGELPDESSELNCERFHREGEAPFCVDLEVDGVFYTRYKDKWAALEPYLKDGYLRFHCEADLAALNNDYRYPECTEIDLEAIPEIIDAPSPHGRGRIQLASATGGLIPKNT